MNNRIAGSPITLTEDPGAWRSIPEVPIAVQDAFGPKATVVLHRERWRGLVPRGNGSVFAWFDGRKLEASALTTRATYRQLLESDADHRALVIGGVGRSIYAVDPSGAATCLGVLPEGSKIESACWWGDSGGVALCVGQTVCLYTPGAGGRLAPRLRFEAGTAKIWSMRCLPHEAEGIHVLAAMDDREGVIHAITDAGVVHVLAQYHDLDMAEVQLFLDETGERTMLLDGPTITTGANITRVGGLAEALAMLDALPRVELSVEPAPALGEGPDLPAPGQDEAKLEVHVAPLSDAVIAPSIDRFPPLTQALIRMLRAAPKRAVPDLEVLELIRSGMPGDLRAYVHAWAIHNLNNPTVYEFWMAPPRLETREFVREHAGDSIVLGTFASGEPIVGRRAGVSCEVVMIDEEGVPYRYHGLEGFLRDLQMRAPDDWTFELDAFGG